MKLMTAHAQRGRHWFITCIRDCLPGAGAMKILFAATLISGVFGNNITQLYEDIFRTYKKEVRGQCLDMNATTVGVDMAFRQIIELDEPHQYIDTLVWLRLYWNDCRLRWTPDEYKGINSIIVPQNMVWIPDLTLYDNTAPTLKGINEFQLKIDANGSIKYQFPSIIRSLCSVNVKHFPFDYQSCKLTFGSWAYSAVDVDIWNVSSTADLSSYVKNTEWHLVGVPVLRLATLYGEDAFPTVTFLIQLKRLPLFYTLNLIFPCLLITSIAILGFLLPPASGEKVNLEITVLLSLAVFQLIVLELMPPTGDTVPFMGLYFILSMVLVAFSCFLTVFVLKIHFDSRHDHPVPNCIRICLMKPLARVFCVKYEFQLPNRTTRSWTPAYSTSFNGHDGIRRKSRTQRVHSISHDFDMTYEGDGDIYPDVNVDVTEECGSSTRQQQRDSGINTRILDVMNKIEHSLPKDPHKTDNTTEWQTLALLLDRLFLVIYVVSLVTIAIVMASCYVVDIPTPTLWVKP